MPKHILQLRVRIVSGSEYFMLSSGFRQESREGEKGGTSVRLDEM